MLYASVEAFQKCRSAPFKRRLLAGKVSDYPCVQTPYWHVANMQPMATTTNTKAKSSQFAALASAGPYTSTTAN